MSSIQSSFGGSSLAIRSRSKVIVLVAAAAASFDAVVVLVVVEEALVLLSIMLNGIASADDDDDDDDAVVVEASMVLWIGSSNDIAASSWLRWCISIETGSNTPTANWQATSRLYMQATTIAIVRDSWVVLTIGWWSSSTVVVVFFHRLCAAWIPFVCLVSLSQMFDQTFFWASSVESSKRPVIVW